MQTWSNFYNTSNLYILFFCYMRLFHPFFGYLTSKDTDLSILFTNNSTSLLSEFSNGKNSWNSLEIFVRKWYINEFEGRGGGYILKLPHGQWVNYEATSGHTPHADTSVLMT
jgi:hypothetical protein